MNLVEVRNAKEGVLPFTGNTIYKFHSLKRYPGIIFKVGGKLFFDLDEWKKEVEISRARNVKISARIHSLDVI